MRALIGSIHLHLPATVGVFCKVRYTGNKDVSQLLLITSLLHPGQALLDEFQFYIYLQHAEPQDNIFILDKAFLIH